jgi:hypothetical protein
MKKSYQEFLAEDFAHDLRFINWVKRGKDDEFWKKFVSLHPHLLNEIEQAIGIINALNYNVVNAHNYAQEVYPEIEKHYINSANKKTVYFISRYLKYAAIFVLLFSLSITTYYLLDKEYPTNQLANNSVNNEPSKGIQLLLPTGQSILLANNTKKLHFNKIDTQLQLDTNHVIGKFTLNATNGGLTQLSTPYGVRLDVVLSDGSKVCLGSGSKLIFPQKFEGNQRRVVLDGEAFFEIAKNKEKPFIVNANDIDVKVLGTEFNINSRSFHSISEVVLVEGSVSLDNLKDRKNAIKLIPSQKATYDKIKKNITVQSNIDVNFYTSWKDGFLEFNRININAVFGRLSDYYNVRFITDSGIEANRNITGKLELKTSLDDVMAVLSDAAFFDYELKGNQVIVKNKPGALPKLSRH